MLLNSSHFKFLNKALTPYLRWFPEAEDVFSSDIEKHSQHFLPIVSLNIRYFLPEHDDFWLHFVQIADIYEGCVGESTTAYHQAYNFADSFCFDVDAQGKYCFNGDWRLFESEHCLTQTLWQKIKQEDCFLKGDETSDDALLYAIHKNHIFYQVIKRYYQKYQMLPDSGALYELIMENQNGEGMIALLEKAYKLPCEIKASHYIDDIAGYSDFFQALIKEEGVDKVEQLFQQDFGNLFDSPKRADGSVFNYIGVLRGEPFQAYGCDELYLFFDDKEKKAVIRLVYG